MLLLSYTAALQLELSQSHSARFNPAHSGYTLGSACALSLRPSTPHRWAAMTASPRTALSVERLTMMVSHAAGGEEAMQRAVRYL